MYQDTFVENFVSRKTSMVMKLISILLLVLCILSVLMFFLTPIFFLPAVVFGLAYYFMKTAIIVDYDYTLTNDQLDIAKVIGKQRRKNIMAIDLGGQLQAMAPEGSDALAAYAGRGLSTKDFTSRSGQGQVYVMALRDGTGRSDEMLVRIEPNEEMVNAIHKLKPRMVHVAETV